MIVTEWILMGQKEKKVKGFKLELTVVLEL